MLKQYLMISPICLLGVLLVYHSNLANGIEISQLDGIKKQFLPEKYMNVNFTIDDLKKIYQVKCKKASGIENSTVYQEIENGAATLVSCLSTFANITAIQEEIEVARPLGELDMIFNKYCSREPEFEDCVQNFNEKLQPCLTKEEIKQNGVFIRIARALLNFVCAKGGDQIALFIAEEGPECLEANKEAIKNCGVNSFSQYLPQNNSKLDIYNLPEFILEPKHCLDVENFEKCTVRHLEKCSEITPANVVESIFKFIKKETGCKTWLQANDRSMQKNLSKNISTTTFLARTLIILITALSILRIFTSV